MKRIILNVGQRRVDAPETGHVASSPCPLESGSFHLLEECLSTAIISDVHGNLEALTTVLADIDNRKADRIICLGDILRLWSQSGRMRRAHRSAL